MTNTRLANRGDRRLVMIDVENLASNPSPTAREVQMVKAALEALVPRLGQAQQIVACSHHAARTVAFEFPGARHLWRSGRNGADLALMDVLENERVDERFRYVTLCSGDGIFAEAAAWLAGRGVEVTVVSLEGHLATRLELAARRICYLTPESTDTFVGSAS